MGTIKIEEPLEVDAPPFGVPENWEWARLGDITELITKGSSPKWQGIAYVPKEEGVLFITSENVGNYRLRKLDEPKYVEKRFNEIEPRSILRNGDVLMNLVGASIGRTAVYDLQDQANINQAVALIRLTKSKPNLCAQFLLHYLNSPSAIQIMMSSQVVTAQPNISLTNAREFPIPIPPLAEQKRIVAKVDELMRWCDALEAGLTAAQTTATHLLDATLRKILDSAFK
jgi:type I restriction enzyme S subunit